MDETYESMEECATDEEPTIDREVAAGSIDVFFNRADGSTANEIVQLIHPHACAWGTSAVTGAVRPHALVAYAQRVVELIGCIADAGGGRRIPSTEGIPVPLTMATDRILEHLKGVSDDRHRRCLCGEVTEWYQCLILQ